MELNRKKMDLMLARKQMTVAKLAEAYGVSRARMNVIMNQREVANVTAGRLAEVLGCDVTEIIED